MEAEHLTNNTVPNTTSTNNNSTPSNSTSSNTTSTSTTTTSTTTTSTSNTASNTNTPTSNAMSNTNPQPVTSAAQTASTQTCTPSTSRIFHKYILTPPVAGPSGLPKPTLSRPNKRSNVPAVKSDSSTVYQSDSSSSSSSDESPTPKRRISLVPNSNMFRNKSEASAPVTKKDSSTCTRKKLFMSRPSAFHFMRSSNSSNLGTTLSNLRRPLSTSLDTPQSRPEPPRDVLPNNLERPERPSRPAPNLQSNSSSTLDDLPFPLGRLRGISEGSLSSADEVINFSERPMVNRDEPDTEPTENFTPDLPTETEFPHQTGNIDNIYSHILSDLETSLREARTNRPEVNRTSDPTSLLNTFSERLENIMNQSDSILANLRHSMEMLMEPAAQQQSSTSNTPQQQQQPSNDPPPPSQPEQQAPNTTVQNPIPSTSMESMSPRRIYILRKPSGVYHSRHSMPRGVIPSPTRNFNQSGSNSMPTNIAMRGSRYFRIRQARFNVRTPGGSSSSVWRPFDDHSYPRDPEQNNSDTGQRSSNIEPIRSLLTLSPRSPSTGAEADEPSEEPTTQSERSSTPLPFPSSDHNYPLPDPPPVNPVTNESPPELNPLNENPIADHTYPRDPQASSSNGHTPDFIAPLVSSLHSTISHISMQTNLLRRQVESIEMIDRARFEVFQLQELRRMWEEIRRHLNFVNTNTSERRSNLSNVRQMMAWTRISDPSPSSESAQSSTEQSTPEPSASTADRPTPSTSRSSASSSNDSRPPASFMNRIRQGHLKKRMYWRRRTMKNENPHFNPRRYLRGHCYRDMTSRAARTELPSSRTDSSNLSEVTVSLMIRGLEHLLTQQSRLLGRRDTQNSPERNNMEYRVQSERVIQNRLRAARLRLNRVSGQSWGGNLSYFEDPVEYSSLGTRNDWVRYETRLRLSMYIETLTRFIENHSNNVPQVLNDQIKTMLELALLLTDLLLLQIMESIPSLSGSILDPERESLSRRITQMCTTMLQNPNTIRSSSLIRVLHELRVNARYSSGSLRIPFRRNADRPSDSSRAAPREAIMDLNRQLRRLYQFSNYLTEPDPFSSPPGPLPPLPTDPSPSTSANDNSMSHVYRLGDLLARLRTVRGRLEQVTQSAAASRVPANTSSSTTEQEPTR